MNDRENGGVTLNERTEKLIRGMRIRKDYCSRVEQIEMGRISVFRQSLFQRSISKTCCSSEDKFITEDTMAKVLQFIKKLCLHINKFVYARARKCERKIGIGK